MDVIQFTIQNKVLEYVPSWLLYLIAFYFFAKICDFVTGLLRTWVKKEKFVSSIMRVGIGRWAGEVIVLAILIIIDFLFGLNWYLTAAQLGLLLYKELGSINENLEKLDVSATDLATKYIRLLGKGDFKK